MVYIRSFAFLIYFYGWSFVCLVGLSPLLLWGTSAAVYVGFIWSNGIMLGIRGICNIRYVIRNEKHLPKDKPFIIACKHQSAWETLIFLKLLHSPVFVLKKELLKIPVYGTYARKTEMIAVDRKGGASAIKDMVKQVKNRLSQNRPVIIFPEGTRTPVDKEPTYYSGIAMMYQQIPEDIPIIPAALNSGLFWPKGSFKRPSGTIVMEYMPPIERGLKKKEFMEKLEHEIETHTDILIQEERSKREANVPS